MHAAAGGRPTAPHLPVFSYCKRDRFLDVLVPGYYTPDRTCAAYGYKPGAAPAAPRVAWRNKKRKAFARCARTSPQPLTGGRRAVR